MVGPKVSSNYKIYIIVVHLYIICFEVQSELGAHYIMLLYIGVIVDHYCLMFYCIMVIHLI